MGKVIGIDLGTTNSCVAVMEFGNPVVISNAEGGRTTPSVVAFTKDGETLIGDAAKRQAAVNAKRTCLSIKRRMGTDFRFRANGRDYSPQEISAMILAKLKKDAEAYLGSEVTKAVITVPAYFSDAQRQATKDAGRIAGMEVLRIINEPTSAALAYGLDHGAPQKILVYDLGGGTFDVSLIEIGDNLIEVLATSGDNHLGGDDFDNRLADYVMETYKKENRINLAKDPTAVQRIREACEQAKKELSAASQTTINLPFIATLKGEPIHLYMDITRAKFEELTSDLLNRTEEPVRRVLSDAGISASELGMVLLVGGSTRMPAVRDKVRALTGKEPSGNLNPDECVALGAAIQGAKLGGELTTGAGSELILMDVTPLSLSIETVGGIATRIIERNTTIPTRRTQIFSTAAPYQTSVEIKVLQGERQFSRDNTVLGTFRLNGIQRAPAGVPQIEVTFDIDANGIVHVSARDLTTGKAKSITITSGSKMSDDEIERAVHDAQVNSAVDMARKAKFDALNDARGQIAAAQQFLSANRKTIDKEVKRETKERISRLSRLTRVKPDRMTDSELSELESETEEMRSFLDQHR
ncbi:MAG: molecular chaperone DnaK [Bilifractor sp.]|jgi:molecular chaperone DnaK